MRKILMLLGILAILTLTMVSCSLFKGPDGADGTAYIQLTYDTTNASGIWYFSDDGYPTGNFYTYTEYATTPATHYGAYILYADYFSGSSITDWNDTVLHTASLGSYANNHAAYVASWPDASIWANTYSYDITVNPGTPGSFPFIPGDDGPDTHFTMYLDWDPYYSSVYSQRVSSDQMKIIEDSATRVVKELTDGKYTLRLTINKTPVPAAKTLIQMK
jgi:hypothetical protein